VTAECSDTAGGAASSKGASVAVTGLRSERLAATKALFQLPPVGRAETGRQLSSGYKPGKARRGVVAPVVI
jgi:hypothetical protein